MRGGRWEEKNMSDIHGPVVKRGMCGLSLLPVEVLERGVLLLVSNKLLCMVAQTCTYMRTVGCKRVLGELQAVHERGGIKPYVWTSRTCKKWGKSGTMNLFGDKYLFLVEGRLNILESKMWAIVGDKPTDCHCDEEYVDVMLNYACSDINVKDRCTYVMSKEHTFKFEWDTKILSIAKGSDTDPRYPHVTSPVRVLNGVFYKFTYDMLYVLDADTMEWMEWNSLRFRSDERYWVTHWDYTSKVILVSMHSTTKRLHCVSVYDVDTCETREVVSVSSITSSLFFDKIETMKHVSKNTFIFMPIHWYWSLTHMYVLQVTEVLGVLRGTWTAVDFPIGLASPAGNMRNLCIYMRTDSLELYHKNHNVWTLQF